MADKQWKKFSMRKFISFFLVLTMVFSITVSTNTASAGTGDTNSQYVVSEQNGLRTVTDQTTGATATYDAMYGVLTYHENHSHTTSISNVDPY